MLRVESEEVYAYLIDLLTVQASFSCLTTVSHLSNEPSLHSTLPRLFK